MATWNNPRMGAVSRAITKPTLNKPVTSTVTPPAAPTPPTPARSISMPNFNTTTPQKPFVIPSVASQIRNNPYSTRGPVLDAVNRAVTTPPVPNPQPINGMIPDTYKGPNFSTSITTQPPVTPPGPNVSTTSPGVINPVSTADLAGPNKTVIPPSFGPNPIGPGSPIEASMQNPNASTSGGPTNPSGRSQFDLQRERIKADAAEEEQRKMAAIERQLAASGIDDSGVLQGQQRTESANIRNAAGRQLTDVNIAEDQNVLAERGMSLQEKSQSDSVKLAEKGLGLQASAQELQRQGMNQQDAQYYAGLGQAAFFQQQGLDQNAVSLKLQEQGMSQQDAQFYAAQKFQKEQGREGIVQDVQKAIIVDQMTKIDPKDPAYLQKLQTLLEALTGLGGVIDPNLEPYTPPATGGGGVNGVTRGRGSWTQQL